MGASTDAARGAAVLVAAAAASDGDAIHLGPGTFQVSGPIDCSKGDTATINLVGAGVDATIIDITVPDDACALTVGLDGGVYKNFTINDANATDVFSCTVGKTSGTTAAINCTIEEIKGRN